VIEHRAWSRTVMRVGWCAGLLEAARPVAVGNREPGDGASLTPAFIATTGGTA
jgi:hypothetical protein